MTHDSKARLSSLNVFSKFASSSSPPAPPPKPPPKDAIYAADTYFLNNRSLASLSPADSGPPTPMSAQYSSRPYLTPTTSFASSKMSLVSSTGGESSTSVAGSRSSSLPRKASNFFKFGKRNKSRPPTPSSDEQTRVDEGISAPWNFQHQIHVNETLMGLPPSWTTQLAQAGFTEEEIIAIRDRKLVGIPRPVSPATTLSSSYSYSTASTAARTQSPPSTVNGSPTVLLSRPVPRGSSLSYSQQQQPQSQQLGVAGSPPLPNRTPVYAAHRTNPSLSSVASRSRQASISSSRLHSESSSSLSELSAAHSTSSSNLAGSPPLPPPSHPPPPIPAIIQTKSTSPSNNNRGPSLPINPRNGNANQMAAATVPTTPPRRVLVVTNDLTSPASPPPAYSAGSSKGNWPNDTKERNLYNPINSTTSPATSPASPPPSATNTIQAGVISPVSPPLASTRSPTLPSPIRTTPTSTNRKSKRFSTSRPPRLSLHSPSSSISSPSRGGQLDVSFGLGLGDWSDTVFEAIDSATSTDFGFSFSPSPYGSGSTSATTASSSRTNASKKSSANVVERDLLPPIILSSNTSRTQAQTQTRRSPIGPLIQTPVIKPLSVASSGSPPSTKSTTYDPSAGGVLLTVNDAHAPGPGQSSPMWDEIMDIMDKQGSPNSARRSPASTRNATPGSGQGRSFGLESPPLPSATASSNGILTPGREETFLDEGEDDGMENKDEEADVQDNRYSTATLLASHFSQRPRSGASYLSAEDLPPSSPRGRDVNRDSSQSTSSTISTVTVTNATVQNARLQPVGGIRAMASFVRGEEVLVGLGRRSEDNAARQDLGRMQRSEERQQEVKNFQPPGLTLQPASPDRESSGWHDEDDEGDEADEALDDEDVMLGEQVILIAPRDGVNGLLPASSNGSPNTSRSPPTSASLSPGTIAAAAGGKTGGFFPHSPISPGTPFLDYYTTPADDGVEDEEGLEEDDIDGAYPARSPEPDKMEFIDRALEERDAFAAGNMDSPIVVQEEEQTVPEPPAKMTMNGIASNGASSAPSPPSVNTSIMPPSNAPPERLKVFTNGAFDGRSQLHPRSAAAGSASTSPSPSPLRSYRGWLSEVVRPLEGFIDESIDPRKYYTEMVEIAECESGSSVYAAKVVDPRGVLKLPQFVKDRDQASLCRGDDDDEALLVAVKSVPMSPGGSPKLRDIERELRLLRDCWHTHILGHDAVYVDLAEDSLWLRMELMERSVADVVMLGADGLMLQERMIARVAADVLVGLEFLAKKGLAHRDLRSDNLLINREGVTKLTDFSSAIKTTPTLSVCSDVAGVVYWQAPEMRQGPYDPMKVDIWSLGATIWEMAESKPPFSNDDDDTVTVSDRWPPLTRPDFYSPAFHEFLRLCSEPIKTRPSAATLSKNSFILNACGRPVIVQLLAQCIAIEQASGSS